MPLELNEILMNPLETLQSDRSQLPGPLVSKARNPSQGLDRAGFGKAPAVEATDGLTETLPVALWCSYVALRWAPDCAIEALFQVEDGMRRCGS